MMLVNVPLVSQLQTATNDGQPSENAQADCVPSSILGEAQAYGQWLDKTPDWVKDQAYGQGYTGSTDPERYTALLATVGITLTRYESGDGNALVAEIERNLRAGVGVLGAIPSQWGITSAADVAAHGGPTHEIAFCNIEADGQLTAMNPWPVNGHNAFYHTNTPAWWASRLVYGHVHVLTPTRTKEPVMSVTPTWNATAGTLAYPAHDGIPAITLDHGQAAYAHDHRAGCYPLEGAFYTAAGDSVVLWDDGVRTRAVKNPTPPMLPWTVVQEDAGPDLAAALGAAGQLDALKQQVSDAKAAQVAAQAAQATDAKTFSAQIAFLKAQVASLGQDKAEQAAQISDLKTQLDAIRSYPRGPVTGNINADAIGTCPETRSEGAQVALVSGGVPMSLFAKARAGVPLSPMQRAWLRVIEHTGFSAALGAAALAVQYMALGKVNPQQMAPVLLGSFLLTLFSGVSKYIKANGDPAIAGVVDAVAGVVTSRVPSAQVLPDVPIAENIAA